MHYTLLLLCNLAAFAIASPKPVPAAAATASTPGTLFIDTVGDMCTGNASDTSAKAVLIQYDDLSPGVQVSVLQNPVGIYHGLQYLGWLVGGPSVNGGANDIHDGIIPESHPNEAVGNPPLNQSDRAITTKYSGSPYSSFDLRSFYFGCAINGQNGAVGVAQGCDIRVIGFYLNGGQTGVATFGFSTANPVAERMVKAVLPADFVSLANVTFGVSSSEATPATTNIYIDSLVHYNWKK